jgi:hypothetical protein
MEKQNKQEALETIKGFLTLMSQQDNRSTARYFYYVLQEPEFIPSDPDFHYDAIVYSCPGTPEYTLTEEEYKKIPDNYETDEDMFIKEDFEPIYFVKIYQDKEVFLTEKEANEHLKNNHYNYHKESRIYVKHFWRTPIQDKFFDALFDYFNIDKPIG